MANRNSDYKYILGMQCFANADSGACIIRTKYDSKEYDYVVINDNLDKCYKEISNLIDSEINKTSKSYDSNLIKKHVDKLIT